MSAALNLVEPLDRQTLGERAYARLADLLISGRLAPGEKLSLRAAADVLGVSIMPVREAVSRLVADKALEWRQIDVECAVMSAAHPRSTKLRIAFKACRLPSRAVSGQDDLVDSESLWWKQSRRAPARGRTQ